MQAGLAGVQPQRLLADAWTGGRLTRPSRETPLSIVAVGKAAAPMMRGCLQLPDLGPVRRAVAVGSHLDGPMPGVVQWHTASHPVPDARSVAAAAAVLEIARAVEPEETLLLLLSGGASALMAAPIEGLTLEDKQTTVRQLLASGATIHELNTIRKHLSAVKGGRLAEACGGRMLTLALSDVVGDDLSVIGSGPGVADPRTWTDVAEAMARHGGPSAYPPAVQRAVQRGLAGDIADTPKPGSTTIARASAHVIGGRAEAMAAAASAAAARGYAVEVMDAAVTGEAREAAARWWKTAAVHTRSGRSCLISSGETTVRVVGSGRGGRNQEFALALAGHLAASARPMAVASVGTDGVDGPTDAAGGLVDGATLARVAARGVVSVELALARNDSYTVLDATGDLLRTGPTGTNVGDLQILLIA